MKFKLVTEALSYDIEQEERHIENLKTLGFKFCFLVNDVLIDKEHDVFIEINSIDALDNLFKKLKVPLIINGTEETFIVICDGCKQSKKDWVFPDEEEGAVMTNDADLDKKEVNAEGPTYKTTSDTDILFPEDEERLKADWLEIQKETEKYNSPPPDSVQEEMVREHDECNTQEERNRTYLAGIREYMAGWSSQSITVCCPFVEKEEFEKLKKETARRDIFICWCIIALCAAQLWPGIWSLISRW